MNIDLFTAKRKNKWYNRGTSYYRVVIGTHVLTIDICVAGLFSSFSARSSRRLSYVIPANLVAVKTAATTPHIHIYIHISQQSYLHISKHVMADNR